MFFLSVTGWITFCEQRRTDSSTPTSAADLTDPDGSAVMLPGHCPSRVRTFGVTGLRGSMQSPSLFSPSGPFVCSRRFKGWPSPTATHVGDLEFHFSASPQGKHTLTQAQHACFWSSASLEGHCLPPVTAACESTLAP